jgi:hypothetical protein
MVIFVLGSFFLGTADNRADFIIDAFNNAPGGGAQGPKISSAMNTPAQSLFTGLTAMGGSRLVWVNNLNGNGSVSIAVNKANDGLFTFTPGAITQGQGFIAWTSQQVLPTINLNPYAEVNSVGLGGTNFVTFCGGSNNAVQIVVESSGGVNATLRVYTDANHYSDLDFSIGDTGANPVTIPLFFSDFGLGAGAPGPADFTSVGALTLDLTSTGGTARFDSIMLVNAPAPVPEPGAFALLGAASLAAVGYRWCCRSYPVPSDQAALPWNGADS